MNPANEEITKLVEQFIEVTEDTPMKRMGPYTEEVGELAAEINLATGVKAFKEQQFRRQAMSKEVADVLFNVVAFAVHYDIDWQHWLRAVAQDNVGGRMGRPVPDRLFPEIVCLCGSTKFKDEYRAKNAELTLEGKIVLTVGFFHHSDDETPPGVAEAVEEFEASSEKAAVDDLHKRKIDLADRVFVINPDGYVGESTRGEIAYAMAHGVPVDWLERPIGPNGGGCWICLTGNGREDDGMAFDREFDTFYHESCLETAGFDSITAFERDTPKAHRIVGEGW